MLAGIISGKSWSDFQVSAISDAFTFRATWKNQKGPLKGLRTHITKRCTSQNRKPRAGPGAIAHRGCADQCHQSDHTTLQMIDPHVLLTGSQTDLYIEHLGSEQQEVLLTCDL